MLWSSAEPESGISRGRPNPRSYSTGLVIFAPMLIFKQFTFDSAHFLPNVPEGHKCRRMHGHTYTALFYIQGEPDPHTGWIMDFGDLKRIIKPLIESLDHKVLNDIPGLENPTCEVLCRWFWQQLKPQLPGLAKIELYETPTSGAVYEG